jgi:uncharacterized cupredoxin-like copper-binding protein
MKYFAITVALAVVSASASAQSPDWSNMPHVAVTLSSFDFTPSEIHLHAGQPVMLHLENTSGGGHNFSAPEFFAGAAIRSQDQSLLRKGTIELSGHQTKEIGLVPRAGIYKLHCTHMMHAAFGMTGRIVVD